MSVFRHKDCDGNCRKLCKEENCSHYYEKSFASLEHRAKCWSNENKENPRKVFKSSHKKFKFDCDQCSHSFEMTLNSVTEGQWCSFCSSQKLCDKGDCSHCYEKSFASLEHRAKCWSKKNKENPRQVFKNCNKKFKFDCDKCPHSFEMRLYHVTNGHWCSMCKRKTEAKVLAHLISLGLKVSTQKTFPFLRNPGTNRSLPFDFFLEEYNLCLEVDGPQHTIQVSNWESPEDTQTKDVYKMVTALSNGFSVIRILQEDIWGDTINWQGLLLNSIQKYELPSIIFLSESYGDLMDMSTPYEELIDATKEIYYL